MNKITSRNTGLRWQSLPIFIVIGLVVMGFGGLFQPGEWYQNINKAPWTPPNIAFPIVWSLLYLLIAIAGWLIFNRGSTALKWVWSTQLFINAIWSWLFFDQHWVHAGLIDLLVLDLLVAAMIWRCFREKLTLAGWLLTPYLAWIVLATSLNAYIAVNN